ncbi:MAG: MBOAT family protein, partial [Muribaculaceae bacterium]|nr:MBOAT family protein [Muribaculaceae bacterium]
MTDLFNKLDFSAISKQLLYDPASPLLFNTGLFLLLFVGFMGIYELLRNHRRTRMVLTILFSLYFYYKSSAEYSYILLGICLSDYIMGRLLGATSRNWLRKSIVFLNIALNLGMLIYFKYFNLLLSSWAQFSGGKFDALDIILPAGISFITFRSISYIVDVYRRDMEPEKNLLNYTFSLTFFPPLLAGPVVRAKDMLPQVRENRAATQQMISEGLFLIMIGLVKKVIIADYISGNFV